METEIWEDVSEKLQNFLIRMSLISHLSFDLITSLAGDDTPLIGELEKQNAYVRRDSYINAYVIHPLFLEFLAQKQETLSENQKEETYKLAGVWCDKNGFKVDAISYFEKIGDYKSIAAILYALPSQIPREIAKYASEILDKAPENAFDTVSFLAIMHISTYLSLGLWEKAVELAEHYEAKYLKMPKTNPFRNDILSGIYYCWGFLRILLCTKDDRYDFDEYFEKSLKFAPASFDIRRSYNRGPGPWINAAGSSRKGAPQEFIDALTRTTSLYTKHFKGLKTGEEELARGELKFYQGDTRAAETYFISALEQARQFKHYEVLQRTLFYILRLAVVQGNFQRAEQAVKEMKSHLEESDYINRFINYDITLCWYNCTLGVPDNVPDWLTDGFSPYGHPAFLENFGNQMKALYFYTTRNYPPLLSYINEVRNREAYLYGRIEMLAMEACVHYRMKDKQKAADSLREAYENAYPNEIIMPFIELGKDMRTLTAFLQKKKDCGIPKDWLETVNLKATSYAKRQAHVATEYKQENSIAGGVAISPRETEILEDLSHGLSRAEIAANRNLSINTVKMVINNIYMKLGAENLADAIRIATERKIV
jgi:LuxR family maltose regulon positive regulatory protein